MTVDEQVVTAVDKTVLFMARRNALRLTKKSRYPIRNPVTGQIDGMTDGQYVAFAATPNADGESELGGSFRCAKEGTVVLRDSLDGGEAEVPAEELLTWLRKHRLFGNLFEGFWEVEPTVPPISEAEIERLTRAATEWDIATLEAIAEQERSGWGRQTLIENAENAVRRIREAEERVRAEVEAEKAAAEAKPKK